MSQYRWRHYELDCPARRVIKTGLPTNRSATDPPTATCGTAIDARDSPVFTWLFASITNPTPEAPSARLSPGTGSDRRFSRKPRQCGPEISAGPAHCMKLQSGYAVVHSWLGVRSGDNDVSQRPACVGGPERVTGDEGHQCIVPSALQPGFATVGQHDRFDAISTVNAVGSLDTESVARTNIPEKFKMCVPVSRYDAVTGISR